MTEHPHPPEFHEVLSIRPDDERSSVEVIRDFTKTWITGLSELVDQVTALMAKAEMVTAEERHQDLVAQERWGDEGGYCP